MPLLLMSVASSAVTIAAQHSAGAMADTSVVPFSLRMENAIVSYGAYIGKTFWPAKLAVFYPLPEHSLPWSAVASSTVILLVITLAVFYFRRARYLVMGWCLFVTTLIPVIGIVQVGSQAMADRYAYIPCVGLFIIVAWGLSDAAGNAAILPRFVPGVAALCLISVFAAATTHYLQYWQNGVKLFTQASIVAGRPNVMIEKTLGDSLAFVGRDNEAFMHYREACMLQPSDAVCHFNMAKLLAGRRQFKDALEQYRLAGIYTNSKDTELLCLTDSAEIMLEIGDYETAEARLAAVLQLDPSNPNALLLRQREISQRSNEKR
jgi:hypothetical protein